GHLPPRADAAPVGERVRRRRARVRGAHLEPAPEDRARPDATGAPRDRARRGLQARRGLTMRSISAVMIAAVLLAGAGGCGSAAGARTTLKWHSCDGRFKCATLSVPVSYSDPDGAKIPISVVELVASRPHPIADIVLNPGGPGASGVQLL